MNKLPRYCYYKYPITEKTIKIRRGETGYFRVPSTVEEIDADLLNEELGVSKAQAEAMYAGSLFGWLSPAANPDMYDENGELIDEKVEALKEDE